MESKQRTSHLSYLREQDAYRNHVLMAVNVNLMITNSGVILDVNHFFEHIPSEILPEPLKLASCLITKLLPKHCDYTNIFLCLIQFSPPSLHKKSTAWR